MSTCSLGLGGGGEPRARMAVSPHRPSVRLAEAKDGGQGGRKRWKEGGEGGRGGWKEINRNRESLTSEKKERERERERKTGKKKERKKELKKNQKKEKKEIKQEGNRQRDRERAAQYVHTCQSALIESGRRQSRNTDSLSH